MWSTPTMCIVCILFGTIWDVKECSQIPKTHRSSPALREEILRIIDQIHSLTGPSEVVADAGAQSSSHSRSGGGTSFHRGASSRSGGDASPLEGVDLNAYYRVLVNLYSLFSPLLSERFVDNLPNTLVCLLSGAPECGPEAELTRTVSLELARPLLAVLSFMRSEASCAPPATGSGSRSDDPFSRSYLRTDEGRATELTGFQEMLISALSQVPLSGNLMSTMSGLLDMVVSYLSTMIATLVQVPMDYVQIGLQFGIQVPSLNESEQCQQGDLKQLIMWGMKHNVSWAFAPSLLDIFLSPEPSLASPNLRTLVCNYANWSQGVGAVDAGVVSLCADNDRAAFVAQVCDSPPLVVRLLSDPSNHWLWGFCGNWSSDPSVLVGVFCVYQGWMAHSVSLPSALVAFCWRLDGERLRERVCRDVGLFHLLFKDPENSALIPNCTHLSPILGSSPEDSQDSLVAEACRYSEWRDVSLVTMNVMSLCVREDAERFLAEVCGNATFLAALLQNPAYGWLDGHCAAAAPPEAVPSVPSQFFSISDWCNYGTWAGHHVDPSVVGLCWQHDQSNFTENICCNGTLFDALFQEPKNEWLLMACGVKDAAEIIPQVCRYSEWTRPIIVDMTDLALCAELDPFNFTTRVCSNGTVLQNLLANLDNTWLLHHCCQYASWGMALPDAPLLALCWDYDQANFASSVCPDMGLLATLAQDASSVWVSQLCAGYANHSANGSGPGEGQPCVARELVKRFNWSCSADLAPVCQPGAGVAATLQAVLRCWVESMGQRLRGLSALNRVASVTVVMLVGLEESQLTSLRVTQNIRLSVLDSISVYLEREANFNNKRVLLQCFGEYFRIPLGSLRAVLSAVDITTARQILQYYSRNRNTLQLTDNYLSVMVSVFLHVHLLNDSSLFAELVPLLRWASLADIKALPPLQADANVRETINVNLALMAVAQRQAFGQWFSRAMAPLNMTGAAPSLITDTGNLIAYLPFQSFQHLSPAQDANALVAAAVALLDGLESLITSCARHGIYLPSHMIGFFLNHTDVRSPASLPPSRLSELVPFLPWLGVDFLQELSQSQLLPAFPALTSVSFTATQASVILDKMPSSYTSAPGGLQALGRLVVGLKLETVRTLTANTLLSSLPGMAQNKAELRPPQANAISTKLWGSPDVVNWLTKVSPLLPSTPLLSVLPHTALLLANSTYTTTQPWNTQQAQALFREVMESKPNFNQDSFLNIGSVGQGVSCPVLRRLFVARPFAFSVKRILRFLREQPAPLHTSLKNCLIKELYNFEFFSELLGEMGAEIALALPVGTVKRFPPVMMDTLRTMILQDPQSFLQLPWIKQGLLVDKMVQRLGMYTGEYTEVEFHSLGVMATFVVDEMFVQMRRSVFLENLELLQGFCYSATKRGHVAVMLQEPAVFGPVQTWTKVTIGQVGRFLFFLSVDTLQRISTSLLTLGHVERLFLDQSQWEASDVGRNCLKNRPQEERLAWFAKQQNVLQYFLGFLRMTSVPSPVVQPGCEILHTLAPSLWPVSSLTSMPDRDFSNCLELMGQDPFLQQYQLGQLMQKVKEVHGPVSSLPSTVIPQLGGLSVELSLEELASLRLTEISSISSMGAVSTWSSRQLPVLFSTVVNSTHLSPNQLDSSSLVAMGHMVCGATAAEILNFNPVEFSKAVLWLGQLRLACTEEQFAAMVTLLSHSLAFDLSSSWGQDVFIEIGVVVAGLPDMSMSSLVKEQIEGITPLAISLILPNKLAVVFDPTKIGMFSYEQAVAVTDKQREQLSENQQRALAMVLTPWEDRPLDFRGRSSGVTVSPSHLCLLLGLLIWLLYSAPPALTYADNFEVDEPIEKAAVQDKWEGEDEEDDVKDNWDDEEEEEKKVEIKKAELKVSEKKKLSEKIKEKENKEKRKKEEELKQKQDKQTPEEQLAEKLRVQKLQEDADLELAKDTFGIGNTANNVSGIDGMCPSSKEDFVEFAKLLKEKIGQFEKSVHYSNFLDSLFQGLCISLEIEDLKKISNSLTVLLNEKQKQEKQNKAKAKKKKGGQPGGGLKGKMRDDLDYTAFEGGYPQDYEDFM
ncbi:hypothetical protein NHX12_006236 [Muraenolepis orangiensis]|uniref:Eukaryotic translation initiation factor 3 subunit J n=1 Tax=Muraenolepis orangiensis TaxID=630683 RepID=A0A9Q0DT26_9TELE|nr:hypothetical protein NHX12_006236 [Muraenolepis orangiensis]